MDTPWLDDFMFKHLGEAEFTGGKPTAFDEMVFSHTNYGPLHGTMPPGCAATLCAALELTGYRSPKSAAAISFAKYGDPCEIKRGAIVVFEWPSGGHHVSVVDKFDADSVVCVGGNQGHHVQPAAFSTKYIIATRWPVKV